MRLQRKIGIRMSISRERDRFTLLMNAEVDRHIWCFLGSGTSTLARELFGLPPDLKWSAHASVRAHLPTGIAGDELLKVVGLSPDIASHPMGTLSGGEQFRARLARSLAIPRDCKALVLEDFTSVLDRPAAQDVAARLQQFAKRENLSRIVIVSCHRDFIGRGMLEPDWLFEVHSGRLLVFRLC